MTMPQATKVRRFVPPTIMCLMAMASVYGSVVSRAGEQIQVEAIDMANPAAVRQALAFNPLDPMQSSQPPAMQDVTPKEAGAGPVVTDVRLAKANSIAKGKPIADISKNRAIGKSSRFTAQGKNIKSSNTFKPKLVKKVAKGVPKNTPKGLLVSKNVATAAAAKGPFGAIMSLGWPALAAIGIGTTAVVVIPIAAVSAANSDSDRSESSP